MREPEPTLAGAFFAVVGLVAFILIAAPILQYPMMAIIWLIMWIPKDTWIVIGGILAGIVLFGAISN